MVKPKASSTPKIVDISRRPPIGEKNSDSFQSPIAKFIPESNLYYDSKSEEESDDVDFNDETDSGIEEKINTKFCNCLNPFWLIVPIIFTVFAIILYNHSGESNNVDAAKILSKEFPSQVGDFWIYVEQGIREIQEFNQPKTFIFLYDDNSEETLYKILDRISDITTCALTNCEALPVILEADYLSAAYILSDYGQIITQNKIKLEESGIMIVKNLEKIPGTSAQAFHSFCDEYNPVVNKALFIFTMKVEKFPDDKMKFVEKYLYNNWKDIEQDKFYPLFTRIANVVLPIIQEKTR